MSKKNRTIYTYTRKPLNAQYVYYDRLKDDGYISDYNKIKSKVDDALNEITYRSTQDDSEILFQMSEAELQKEMLMLEQNFGTKFPSIMNQLSTTRKQPKEFYKNLIKLLNYALGVKEIFKRNVALTKETKGQTAVFAFFGEYFSKAFDEEWPNLERLISQNISRKKLSQTNLETTILDTYNSYVPQIMNKAFQKMFAEANVENGIEKNYANLKNAYEELLVAINTGRQDLNNPFLKEFYQLYKLDEIGEGLKKRITAQQNSKLSKKERDEIITAAIKTSKNDRSFYTKKGFALEAFENKLVSYLLNKISKVNNVTVKSYRTNAYGLEMKADNIYTIGINSPAVDQLIKQKMKKLKGEDSSARAKYIERVRKISDELKNLNEGFIIYSSDKFYTTNDDFVGRGGFGGGDQSFKNFLATIQLTDRTIIKNFDTVIGAIMQYANGALYGGRSKTIWEEKIAQDVAFMLFDDFDTIGKKMQSHGANAIHIMNLNGIMLPLSFILYLMGCAVEEGTRKRGKHMIEKYAHVRFEIPKILYEENSWENESELAEAWERQREEMLDKAEIKIHFLKDFRNIIKEFTS